MALTSTQLPPLLGAEQRRRAILRGKQQAFRFSFVLVIAVTLLSMFMTLRGQNNFPGAWAYWLTNAVVLGISVWGLLSLRNTKDVRLVEQMGLAGCLIYLLGWDLIALLSHYPPRAEFLMTNAAVFLFTSALACLVFERRLLPYMLFGLFTAHSIATWSNLLQFPWGRVHNAQLTTDLVMMVATIFLYLIGSFQHLLSTSPQEAELVRVLVNTDELTGLANSRSIAAQLEAIPCCAVVLLEIEDFDGLLIDLGEDRTEQTYFLLARTLRQTVGKSGSCGRWGTSQFAVLMPYAGHAAALALSDDLRRAVAALDLGEPFTVRMGLAVPGENLPGRENLRGIEVLHVAAERLSQSTGRSQDQPQGRTMAAQESPQMQPPRITLPAVAEGDTEASHLPITGPQRVLVKQ